MGRRGWTALGRRRKVLGCRRQVQMKVGHVSRFSRLASPSASHAELQIRGVRCGAVRLPRFASTGSWQGSRAGCHGRRSGPSEPSTAVIFLEKWRRAARRRPTHTTPALISPFGPNLRPATGSDQSARHAHTPCPIRHRPICCCGEVPSNSQAPPKTRRGAPIHPPC